MARPAEHLSPVLQHGFRPFFLLGALWAAAALGLWLAALTGAVGLPSAFEPLAWHIGTRCCSATSWRRSPASC